MPGVIDILEGRPPANTARVEVNILPGVQYRYSGGGITVAQLLVADTLGRPFPQIMKELVLDPLAMKHSTYEQPLPPAHFPPAPETSKVAGAALDALSGEYETEAKVRFKVARQGESLLLTAGSQPPLALVPRSDTSFLLSPLNGKVTFEKDAQGRGSKLTLEQAGGATTAERVGG